ncbi:hypothetical protein FKX85_01965 [Echinicola soli]|uniref:Lipocalin-like domain-containing protein n=1 Tax=Echinicola soli TaxID=2591634 RepID=A0A514CDZ5_9BACT|nr:hypothetical protein [Echinicola soli]QDH77874.1 hypothetical protein FKX85_01965 [Echinicola soli]
MNKFSFILLLFLFAGCNADAPEPIQTMDGIKKEIIGEWNWEETIVQHRGQDPVVKTPESEGKTKTHIFNEEGRLIILENGVVLQESNYIVVSSPSQNLPEFKLNISEPAGSLNITISNNKLTLSTGLGTSSSFTGKLN